MEMNGAMKQDRRQFLKIAGATAAALTLNGLPLVLRAASGDTEKMTIGIVGSGRVGGTLGGD